MNSEIIEEGFNAINETLEKLIKILDLRLLEINETLKEIDESIITLNENDEYEIPTEDEEENTDLI